MSKAVQQIAGVETVFVGGRLTLLLLTLLLLALVAKAQSASSKTDRFLSPSDQPLTEKERGDLDKGTILVQLTVVPDSPVKRASAVALVEAPPEEIFAVLMDYDNYPEFMPYCRKVKLQKKKDDELWVRFELDFPWPIGDRYYVLHLTNRREEESGSPVIINSWTYEPDSGNINDTYGSWEIVGYGENRSFVRYTVFTDPAGHIPTWAKNMASEVAVPKVINGLRKRVAEKVAERESVSEDSAGE